MPPIISIIGRSDSGKTTLLESLIAELKRRGYKVAVIKHVGEGIELDTANKDSWRLSRAGSDITAISSKDKLAIFKNLDHDFSPEELSHIICSDYDLILTEGFKQSPYPKIEVHRKELGKELLSPPEQLLAVVTDESLEVSVPQFSPDETTKIADLIERKITQNWKEEVKLMINDEPIPLSQTTKDLLTRTLIALAASRKRVSGIKSLRLSLRRKT